MWKKRSLAPPDLIFPVILPVKAEESTLCLHRLKLRCFFILDWMKHCIFFFCADMERVLDGRAITILILSIEMSDPFEIFW